MRSSNAHLTRSLSNILIWGCASQRLRLKALHDTHVLLPPDLLNLLINTRNALVSHIPPAHTILGSYWFFLFFFNSFTFPGGSDGKECAFNVRDLDLIPGLGRFPEGGNGYPLQDSCLENPMDRRAWWDTVHGVAKSQTQLSD